MEHLKIINKMKNVIVRKNKSVNLRFLDKGENVDEFLSLSQE